MSSPVTTPVTRQKAALVTGGAHARFDVNAFAAHALLAANLADFKTDEVLVV
ncbi:MAG: hypothetical protein V2I76_15160 [Roseobacter sp.]|jgi:hypothetical protein|nr:hypothetical protein [Roseobacter sp.]